MSLKYAESIKEGSHEPRQAKPRHILRAVRLRCEHVLRYEHAKATYRARAEPQTSPRKPKGAWHCFHSHWIATGIAAITRTGPRLNLLRAAPPAAPVQPGAVHIRVTAVLLPPSGAKPTRSAWAMEAHDVAADGTQSERLRASGAIATAATHAANRREVAAPRHTWQVALQVAAGRRRRYAAQQRSRGRSVAISLPSATTARDLQPPLPLTATAQPRRGATEDLPPKHSEKQLPEAATAAGSGNQRPDPRRRQPDPTAAPDGRRERSARRRPARKAASPRRSRARHPDMG